MNILSAPEEDITFIFQGFLLLKHVEKNGLGIKLAVPWLINHTGMGVTQVESSPNRTLSFKKKKCIC